MQSWLDYALDYVPQWLEYQMRHTQQPGCVIAVVKSGTVVLDRAFGRADLKRDIPLTPLHRFRIASHSKSFTAAGIMKLRERDDLQLDDQVSRYLDRLHPQIAAATIGQLLSHTAGLVRDGADNGQWSDRRPFLSEEEIRADLADGPVIEPNTRMKYSNHGYGLLGLVIEEITGEPYRQWIAREIIAAAGLNDTEPDMPMAATAPFARGHSSLLPLGRRVVIPGDNPTNALAPATGFVGTAADLARFFNQLAPEAETTLLSVESRREMTRGHWPQAHSTIKRCYGLGIEGGEIGAWSWFGHGGGFQGYVTRTLTVPDQQLTVAVLTNASDGPAQGWAEGTLHILQRFAQHGAPLPEHADWAGRWWGLWGAIDLLAMEGKVMIASPGNANPLLDGTEITLTGRDEGRIDKAHSLASHGETVRRERDAAGVVTAIHLGGHRLQPEPAVAAELRDRYEAD